MAIKSDGFNAPPPLERDLPPDDAVLDLFGSEPVQQNAAVATSTPAPTVLIPASQASVSGITLAELLSSGESLEWFEAVAIVQALAQSILDSGDRIGPAELDLKAVIIYPDGEVSASTYPRADANAAVHCIGQILADTLPNNDFMFLRERVVAKATASPPSYASVADLARALEYYERPNRIELIREVHDRWRPAPVRTDDTSRPGIAVSRTEPAVAPVFAQPPGPRLRPRHLVAPAIAIAAVMCGLAVWAFTALPPIQSAAAGAFTTTVAEDRSAASPAAPQPPRKTRSSVAAVTTPSISSAPSASPVRAVDDVALPPASSVDLAEPRVPAELAPVPTDVPEPSEATTRGPDQTLFVPVTYSARNSDVLPPVIIPAQSLSASLGSSGSSIGPIEVIVDELGDVESVKATVAPRTIAESLLVIDGLHAAKAWHFHPAERKGQPVRYRLLVQFDPQ